MFESMVAALQQGNIPTILGHPLTLPLSSFIIALGITSLSSYFRSAIGSFFGVIVGFASLAAWVLLAYTMAQSQQGFETLIAATFAAMQISLIWIAAVKVGHFAEENFLRRQQQS